MPEVAAIEGVARADLTGGLETRLAVTLDPAKLTSSGVSTQQVVAVLGANNLTLPSGQLPADGSRTPVSTIGRLTSAEEVEALVVGYAGTPPAATPVTIGDLGTVELDSIATTGYGRTNGQPALTLTVSKTSNANTVEVADAVQAKLSEIAARHADVMTVSTVQDLSVFIKESRDGLLREGGLGAIFAVIVDLPVPAQPAGDDRRRDQHPALDPDRAGDHADHRRHDQHHDPGWPRGRRRAGGR